MNPSSLVRLAITAQRCTQKELAHKLSVSPAQISKWKRGEHISEEMGQRLRDLAGVGELGSDFVSLAGSIEDAKKWQNLIRYLAEVAEFSAETGYDTAPLVEEIGEDDCPLFFGTLSVLQEMGVEIPRPFPAELDFDYEDEDSDDVLFSNSIALIIRKIFGALTNVYGFYAAYVSDLIYDDDLNLSETPAWELESDMLRLAAAKLEDVKENIPGFGQFKWEVESEVEKKLVFLKKEAIRARIPLGAELLDLIYEEHEVLGFSAERKAHGFGDRQIHPDIYINELLVGIRVIHKILPVIMKKIGVFEDFKLDESDLGLGRKR